MSQLPRREEITGYGYEERWELIASLLLILPYIIWAAFRPDSFGDTVVYRNSFLDVPSAFEEWGPYISSATKDKGFTVLSLVCKQIVGNSDILFFFIIAAFQLICVAWLFRKYSCDYWFSIFVFIASCNYLAWTWNGVRQFIAAAIVYFTTGFIVKKKYIITVLLILVAATFHASALMMIPMVFIIQGKAFNFRSIALILGGVLVIFYTDTFSDILDGALVSTQYDGVVEIWEEAGDNGMNPLQALVYSVPAILSVAGIKRIKAEPDPVINLAVNASFATAALSMVAVVTSGLYMGRLPIYVSLYSSGILLPWEIHHFFEPFTARYIKIVAIGFYILMFYLQMHLAWSYL